MAGRASLESGDHVGSGAHLRLLGLFGLEIDGQPVDVTLSVERLLALLVVLGGQAHRSQLAALLWPEQLERRSLSNLRTTLWRMPACCRDLLVRRGATVSASAALHTDQARSVELARRLLDGDVERDEIVDHTLLVHDLLPGFDEPWLVIPRERHHQLRLHALEASATLDLERGRVLDAVDTTLIAVAAEPLRESAQLLLVRAHLAAGNRAAAIEQFVQFRDLLAEELGVPPSQELTALVARATGRPVTRL